MRRSEEGRGEFRRGGSDVRRDEKEDEEEGRRKGIRRYTASSTQLVEQKKISQQR